MKIPAIIILCCICCNISLAQSEPPQIKNIVSWDEKGRYTHESIFKLGAESKIIKYGFTFHRDKERDLNVEVPGPKYIANKIIVDDPENPKSINERKRITYTLDNQKRIIEIDRTLIPKKGMIPSYYENLKVVEKNQRYKQRISYNDDGYVAESNVTYRDTLMCTITFLYKDSNISSLVIKGRGYNNTPRTHTYIFEYSDDLNLENMDFAINHFIVNPIAYSRFDYTMLGDGDSSFAPFLLLSSMFGKPSKNRIDKIFVENDPDSEQLISLFTFNYVSEKDSNIYNINIETRRGFQEGSHKKVILKYDTFK